MLNKNIEKPQYYVAGEIKVSQDLAYLASSYSHVFIALYASEEDKMPYGAFRQQIKHNFTRGSLHFVINKANLFVMQPGKELPKKIKIKATLSRSAQVSPGSLENYSDIKTGISLGETHVSFDLKPQYQARR